MTIKPINRMIGGTIICRFTPWYYIINQKIIQVVKLEKSREPFGFKTQVQKFSQTCCFHMIVQNNILKKTFPEKSNDKTFKEI